MDYEKEYKGARERCRKLYKEAKVLDYTQDLEDYEYIFPELKESEDERIRKELIEFVKIRGGFKQEYIAWLEKQGEQKPVEWSDEDEIKTKAEVDIEKTLNGFQNFYAHENSGEFPSAIEIAEHFFELGLKAKGE